MWDKIYDLRPAEKSCELYRLAYLPVILNGFEGHFKYDVFETFETFKILHLEKCSRPIYYLLFGFRQLKITHGLHFSCHDPREGLRLSQALTHVIW